MALTTVKVLGDGPLAQALLSACTPQIALVGSATESGAAGADCAVITEREATTEDTIIALLKQGISVICALPVGQFQPELSTIRQLCEQHQAAFHQTSLLPQMLSERLTMTLSKGLERIDHVRIVQSTDVSGVNMAPWGGLRASGLCESPDKLELLQQQRTPNAHAIACNIARQLYGNAEPVRLEARHHATVAEHTVTLPDGEIQAGTVKQCVYHHDAWLGDRHFLTLEEHWHPGGRRCQLGERHPLWSYHRPLRVHRTDRRPSREFQQPVATGRPTRHGRSVTGGLGTGNPQPCTDNDQDQHRTALQRCHAPLPAG